MNDTPARDAATSGTPPMRRSQMMHRLVRLMRKELREILRDRRTIGTLVVMPLLVYPLLALVFQRFLLTSLAQEGPDTYVVGVESEQAGMLLAWQINRGMATMDRHHASDHSTAVEIGAGPVSKGDETQEPLLQFVVMPEGTAERNVIDAAVHLAALSNDPERMATRDPTSPTSWKLIYRPGAATSEDALRFVESCLREYSDAHLQGQLRQLGVATTLPVVTSRHAVSYAGAPIFSLAALIPLILILTTVTGAVYPAIDLTAGERERGTLESLIAAPVPRHGLLLAKYVAVLTVALLTAVINLAAMTITARSTGLSASLFGEAGMQAGVVIKVLVLLALFAAFFSAVLLAATSYARSFKEAQAYIIPLMLLCLVPGVMCLAPGLEFTGGLAVTPLVNIVLLSREVLQGSVDPGLATVAVVSTAFYIAAAIALAARIFGTDAILYGSQFTWSDLFRRPDEPQAAASTSAAAFCLAAMFPSYFVLSASLASSQSLDLGQRMIIGGLITAVVFAAIPWAVAAFGRVRLRDDWTLDRVGVVGLLAAAILGLTLWPLAHEVFLFGDWLMTRWFGSTDVAAAFLASNEGLLDQWRSVPYSLILITLAVVPAVCEEFMFRGVLFTSLQNVLSARRTIVVCAVLFGLFHIVAGSMLAPERFLPSTFLGLVLGWARYRTGSVLPCAIVHAVHNGVLWSIVYWRDELVARGIGVQEMTHLPAVWLTLAVLAASAAAAMLILGSKAPSVGAPH